MNIKSESDVYNVVKGDFVVKALFKFTYESFICFVMEYMYGGDFSKILENWGCLDLKSKLSFFNKK